MLIRCGYEIIYDCPAATPMLLLLNVHPSRRKDLVTRDLITTDPQVPVHTFQDRFGNTCARITAPAGRTILASDFLIRDSGEPDACRPDARQVAVEDLPDDVVPFLLGSRYCETDVLSPMAWSLFGNTQPGWARVQAIVDYVHDRIDLNKLSKNTDPVQSKNMTKMGPINV